MTQQRNSEPEIKSGCVLFESTPLPPPQPPAHLDNFQAGSHGNIIGQDSQIPHAWPIHKTETGQRDTAGLVPHTPALNNPACHMKQETRAIPCNTDKHLTLAAGFTNWALVTAWDC